MDTLNSVSSNELMNQYFTITNIIMSLTNELPGNFLSFTNANDKVSFVSYGLSPFTDGSLVHLLTDHYCLLLLSIYMLLYMSMLLS